MKIMRHQLDRALGNIRVLGPDIPDFRKDVKLVSDYIDQVEHDRDLAAAVLNAWRAEAHHWYLSERAPQSEFLRLLVNQPDTVVRSSGAKEA